VIDTDPGGWPHWDSDEEMKLFLERMESTIAELEEALRRLAETTRGHAA
jgi:hypothetical protein